MIVVSYKKGALMEVRARTNEPVIITRIPEWKDVEEDITTKLRNIIEQKTYVDRKDGDEYGYEVYIDTRYDVFSDLALMKISKDGTDVGTDQYDYINEEYGYEWEMNEKDAREDEIIKYFKEEYPREYTDYEYEIGELLRDMIYAYINPDDLNQKVDVAITLDVGDMNYDFNKNNVFNMWQGDCELDKLSPIAWLAKQQRKLTELKKAIHQYSENTYTSDEYSLFTQSCIEELINQTNCMSCMTFLVRMGLTDYIKLQGMIRRQKKLNEELGAEYDYNKRKDDKEYIVIDKNIKCCGLFNPWLGGGSMLEIKPEKDIKIPMKAIWQAWIEVRGGCPYGYTIDEVYGLVRSEYNTQVKLKGKNPWE